MNIIIKVEKNMKKIQKIEYFIGQKLSFFNEVKNNMDSRFRAFVYAVYNSTAWIVFLEKISLLSFIVYKKSILNSPVRKG